MKLILIYALASISYAMHSEDSEHKLYATYNRYLCEPSDSEILASLEYGPTIWYTVEDYE